MTRVSAEEVAELAKQNVTIVDTRSQKEYDSEHVRGAILASYLEKSLKEVDFDASKDDFSALKSVPKDKPVVFLCNGPECWKSYKASRAAVAAGYSKIYWFRGGMPEWRDKRLPVEGTAGAALAKIPRRRSQARRQGGRRGALGLRGRGRAGLVAAPQVDDALGLLALEPEPAVDALVAEVDHAAEHALVDLLAARRARRSAPRSRPGACRASDRRGGRAPARPCRRTRSRPAPGRSPAVAALSPASMNSPSPR